MSPSVCSPNVEEVTLAGPLNAITTPNNQGAVISTATTVTSSIASKASSIATSGSGRLQTAITAGLTLTRVLRNAGFSILVGWLFAFIFTLGNLASGKSPAEQSYASYVTANGAWFHGVFSATIVVMCALRLTPERFVFYPKCSRPSPDQPTLRALTLMQCSRRLLWYMIPYLTFSTTAEIIGCYAMISCLPSSDRKYKPAMYMNLVWGNLVLPSAEYCTRTIYRSETVRGLAHKQLRESRQAMQRESGQYKERHSPSQRRYSWVSSIRRFMLIYLQTLPGIVSAMIAIVYVHSISLFADIDRQSELLAFAICSIALKLTLQEAAKRLLLTTKEPLPRRTMIVLVSTPTILVDTQVRMLLMRLQKVAFSFLGSILLAFAEISVRAIKSMLVHQDVHHILKRRITPTFEKARRRLTVGQTTDSRAAQVLMDKRRAIIPARPVNVEAESNRQRYLVVHAAEIYTDMYAEYMAMGCSYAIMFFFGNHPQYQFVSAVVAKSETMRQLHYFLIFAFQVLVEIMVDFVACNIEVTQGVDFGSFNQNDPYLTFLMSVLAFANVSISAGLGYSCNDACNGCYNSTLDSTLVISESFSSSAPDSRAIFVLEPTMKIGHLIPTVVAMTVPTIASANSSSSSRSGGINGWYPCSELTFSDEGGSENQDAECAIYTAPLCYPSVCDTPDNVVSTVDIFVKRLVAVTDSDAASNVWIMQGGPGASSTAMESAMMELHTRMNGAVNVYTMDHRGTGRSTLLDCVAAQATTTGSPSGSSIDVSEVPACAESLEKKYGNLSSFSMTSAAMDMTTFISSYSNGADTIVYGVSYGTALVERIIHLDPPEVTGYVLDGVATSSGASGNNFEYFSTWDADFGEVGDAFMALCATKSECSERFESTNLSTTLQDVIVDFDNNPNSTCAALVSTVNSAGTTDPASYIVREALGSLLQSASMRTLIPPVVYRLNRCASEDIDVLTHFFMTLNTYISSPDEENAFESTLLYYLIVFSEMWEKPEPSMSEMLARFTDTTISNGGTYTEITEYCAFSKENSSVCAGMGLGNYNASGIIYKRDEYWNKSASIPSQASVLLLSSKLDPQTPHKYAEYLLGALKGTKKELVTFNYATHGTLWTTPIMYGDDTSETCGMKLLISYVNHKGDLEGLDKSCVGEMPAFNLTAPVGYLHYFLSTDDAYDGAFDATLSASGPGSSSISSLSNGISKYTAEFIVFLVLFVVALVFSTFFGFRWYKLKYEKADHRMTEDFAQHIELSSPVEVDK
ncbi:unnamed protein product [Phytophthora fragariaefolia]|uniref:Unnamed protein product n=1 Tax=Phytophthora fragariaefolia TaxID=1490495 RepID=A0A9W6XNJ3_9STRA|nr:unnamed protein product [Phytophthora fragariaefolia]